MLNINIISNLTTIETTHIYSGIHLFSPQITTVDKIVLLENVQCIVQRENDLELSMNAKQDIFNTLVKDMACRDGSYAHAIQGDSLRFLIDNCTNINTQRIDNCTNINTQRIDSIISFDLCNDKIYLFDWINSDYLDTQRLSVSGIDHIISILQDDTNSIF